MNDFWERKNSANIERNTPHFKNFQVDIEVAGQGYLRNPCFTYSWTQLLAFLKAALENGFVGVQVWYLFSREINNRETYFYGWWVNTRMWPLQRKKNYYHDAFFEGWGGSFQTQHFLKRFSIIRSLSFAQFCTPRHHIEGSLDLLKA